MNHRPEIQFGSWMPVARDHKIAYSYVNPRDGRRVRRTGWWMAVRPWIAQAALATGQDTFTIRGGLGSREWQRILVCTEEQAVAFFEEAVQHGSLTGNYRRALAAKRHRLRRESATLVAE